MPLALPQWIARDIATAAGLGLVAAIWATTGLVQVPLHRRLSRGHDPSAIRRLITTNWIRTVLWTGRLGWLAGFGTGEAAALT